jgi:hypothetical protein
VYVEHGGSSTRCLAAACLLAQHCSSVRDGAEAVAAEVRSHSSQGLAHVVTDIMTPAQAAGRELLRLVLHGSQVRFLEAAQVSQFRQGLCMSGRCCQNDCK